MSERPRSTAGVAMLLLALAALVHADAAGFRLTDPDFFVNLYTGRQIVEQGSIPGVDTVTFTVAGEPWEDYEWISRVVFYACWQAAGGAGLVLLRLGLVAAMLALFWAQARRHAAGVGVWTVALAVFAIWAPRYLLFRTRLFSFVGLAALLTLLDAARCGRPRRLWLVPPLMALWANVHAGFALGMVLLGMLAVESTLRSLLSSRWSWLGASPGVPPLAAWGVLAGSIVAGGLHPFGYDNWLAILETMRGGISPWISEWAPLWSAPASLQLRTYGLIAAAGVALWLGRERIGSFEALVFVSLSAATVMRLRFVPLLAIAVVVFLLRALPAVAARWRVPRRPAALAPVAALALLCLVVVGEGRRNLAIAKTPRFTPVRAVEFMKANGIDGRILNELDWGGYVAFSLPGSRIFVDARSDTVYPPALLGEWYRFVAAEGWRQIARRRDVDVVLLRSWHVVVPELRSDPDWVEIYRTPATLEPDPGARESLFVRVGPRHAELVERFRTGRLLLPRLGPGNWRV